MNDEQMRLLLRRKLEDPAWQAEQAHRYNEIVAEGSFFRLIPVRESAEPAPFLTFDPDDMGLEIPDSDPEQVSIESLWMGNWQRSYAGHTITRYPDETVVFETADGLRTVYRPVFARRGRHTWHTEVFDPFGVVISSKRWTARFEDAEEALIAMHQSALADFEAAIADA